MRSECEELATILQFPAVIRYQFDDSTPDAPHYVEWRGVTVNGKTLEAAKYALGLEIGIKR